MELVEKDAFIDKLMEWRIQAGDEAARANRNGDNELYQFDKGFVAALEAVVKELEDK